MIPKALFHLTKSFPTSGVPMALPVTGGVNTGKASGTQPKNYGAIWLPFSDEFTSSIRNDKVAY